MNTVDIHKKNKKFTAIAWALAALILAVIIPFNLIFGRLNINFDMTPNSLYTLTKTTTDYLDSLERQNIKVDVYFLMPLEEMEGELELLALYRTLLAYDEYECFNLIDFDPDTEPQLLKDLNPNNVYNLTERDFMFSYNGMVKRMPARLMYTYETATDENGNDYVVNATFNAENYLTGAMKSVVDGVQPTVYFLEGHGETPLSSYTKLVTNFANYNYGVKALNLINAEKVPDDACILVMAGPRNDITDDEFEKINAFLDQGGNLSLLMTPNDSEASYTNIASLMARFCIGMDYNRIYETDSARHASNDKFTFMCDLMPASSEAETDLTGALIEDSGLIPYMPASRSFYSIYSSNYSTCNIDTLLETSTTAYGEPYGGAFEDPEPTEGHKMYLAMYSEDTLRKNAKLAVFGSAEFLTDKATDSSYFIVPLNLFLTTVTWMYNSDINMNIDNKEKTYDTLNINSADAASGLIALFVAVPCVVALAGIVIWLRRKDA